MNVKVNVAITLRSCPCFIWSGLSSECCILTDRIEVVSPRFHGFHNQRVWYISRKLWSSMTTAERQFSICHTNYGTKVYVTDKGKTVQKQWSHRVKHLYKAVNNQRISNPSSLEPSDEFTEHRKPFSEGKWLKDYAVKATRILIFVRFK